MSLIILLIPFRLVSMDKPVQLTPLTKPAPARVFTSQELKKQFTNAIQNEDVAKVKKLLAQQPALIHQSYPAPYSIYPTPRTNISALAFALFTPRISFKIIEALLDAGANVNEEIKDEYENSPLTLLLTRPLHSHDIAKLLLDRGANHNYANKKGDTPLIIGVWDPEIVKLLLKTNVNINAQNNEGKTALMQISGMNYNIDTIKQLLFSGPQHAPVARKEAAGNNSYLTILPPEIAEIVAQYGKADPNIKDNKGKTALDYAQEAYEIMIDRIKTTKEIARKQLFQDASNELLEIINLLKSLTKK